MMPLQKVLSRMKSTYKFFYICCLHIVIVYYFNTLCSIVKYFYICGNIKFVNAL